MVGSYLKKNLKEAVGDEYPQKSTNKFLITVQLDSLVSQETTDILEIYQFEYQFDFILSIDF